MSGIAGTLNKILLSWIRPLSDAVWALLSGDGGSFSLSAFFSGWKMWLIVLICIGLVMDWLIHLLRWQPYKVWFRKKIPDEQDSEQLPAKDNVKEEFQPVTGWTEYSLPPLSEIDKNWEDTLTAPLVEESVPLSTEAVTYAVQNVDFAQEDESGPVSANLNTQEACDGVQLPEEEYEEPEADVSPTASGYEESETHIYGILGAAWPVNASPMAPQTSAPADSVSLTSKEGSVRRRRHLHESERSEQVQESAPSSRRRSAARTNHYANETVVIPQEEHPSLYPETPRKSAFRRGLASVMADDEEYVSGLPPMEGGDAFHAPVHPDK